MVRVWLSVNLKRHGVDCRGPSGASVRGHARTGLECGGRSAPVLISDLDHRAVADDHRDVAVPHREVAGHWPGDHTGVGSPTRCAPLVQVWALCPEGGVVTVSGLDDGSSPNQVKTLLPRFTLTMALPGCSDIVES